MYYYIDSRNQQCGPVPASTLKNYGVTLESYVWTNGMQNWAKAKTIPELQSILVPSYQQQRANFSQSIDNSYSSTQNSTQYTLNRQYQRKKLSNGIIPSFIKQHLRRIVVYGCAAGSAYCLSMWIIHDLNASHAEYAIGGIALAIIGFLYYKFERKILEFLGLH